MRLLAAVRLVASASVRNLASAASRAAKSGGDTGELNRQALESAQAAGWFGKGVLPGARLVFGGAV